VPRVAGRGCLRMSSESFSPSVGAAARASTRERVLLPALALLWGLADATVFFILPDALISRLAIRDGRRVWRTALWALAGALIGATILWSLAHSNHDRTQVLLNTADRLPGISREHMVRSAQAVHEHGASAIGVGALLGQPYKLFAIHAGAQDLALAPFLAASAIGIAARLALTSAIAWLLSRALAGKPRALILRVHLWAWMFFYAAYFALVK
jgi:membrane protein YqaA with SNARE-associated domain